MVVWLLVLGLAGGMALAGGLTSPWLVLQSLFVFAGVATTVVYITSADEAWAWAAAGCALLGAVTTGLGVQTLLSEDTRFSSAGQIAEEIAASLAGLAVPMLAALAFLMTLAAVGVTEVS